MRTASQLPGGEPTDVLHYCVVLTWLQAHNCHLILFCCEPFIIYLSGSISIINPSTETMAWFSSTPPDCLRFCIRSSAPLRPAVNPTGWAAVVA